MKTQFSRSLSVGCFMVSIAFILQNCSSDSFTGSDSKSSGGSSFNSGSPQTQNANPNGNVPPTAQMPEPTATPGTPSDGINVSTGTAILQRSIVGFAFSGDGPGSCALNASCRPGAPACPAGYTSTAQNYQVGDCYKSGSRGTCFANRKLCVQSAELVDRVTTNFQFFSGRACPAGFEPSGPVGALNHVFGIADQSGNYSEVVACRTTIPKDQIPAGTKVVTDIVIVGVGHRYSVAKDCPADYVSSGVISDCVWNSSVTPAGTPGGSCSGKARICQKLE